MRDPFGERRGKFQWKVLGEKLAMLKENNPQWFAEVKIEIKQSICLIFMKYRAKEKILAVRRANSVTL